MNIELIPLKMLKPYKQNPRVISKDAIQRVAQSIKEFGFRQPIVCDREYNIVVGHVRYLAAKELKLTHVPVHIADNLTEEQVRKYRLIDNRTNEFTSWDIELLKLELDELGWNGDEFQFDALLEELQVDVEHLTAESSRKPAVIYGLREQYEQKLQGIYYTKQREHSPEIDTLYDDSKANEFLSRIENANIHEPLKQFLRYAAYRFVKIDYDAVAEYYCHADEQTRELFRELILVIPDEEELLKQNLVRFYTEVESVLQGDENDEEADFD